MILRTRQRSFKPAIEPIEPAIKKVRSGPSLVPNLEISNGLIHEAAAITEDLLLCMLRMQVSIKKYQIILNCSGFFKSLESSNNKT